MFFLLYDGLCIMVIILLTKSGDASGEIILAKCKIHMHLQVLYYYS